MIWVKPKPRTIHLGITDCFYGIFSAILLFLLTTAPGSASITKPLFRSKLPIPVKHRLTIFPFSSCFSRFLNLSRHFSSQHTTYYIRHTFFKRPPILLANHPILHGNHPILLSSHPIQRGNHPRVSAWGSQLPALCTARLSSPKSVHCSLSTA